LEAGASKASVFAIGGGKRPYTVTSSDSSVVAAGQSGEEGFALMGVRPGSATVVIKDASGQAVNIAVTTRPTKDLSITAPSALILALNAKQPFVVSGGAEPFSSVSSNPSVAQVSRLTGTDFSIQAIRSGTAQINVTDANGSKVSVDVTVSPGVPLFSTAPSALSLFVDTAQPYKLGGGVPPYTVRSSNPGVLDVVLAQNGTDLMVKGLAVGSSSIVVTDEAGASATISSVTVARAQQLLAVVPNPVVLSAPLAGQVATASTYPIAGAKIPLVARSSDESIVKVSVDFSSGSPVLNVVPLAVGTARLLLTDALGGQFTSEVTVSSAAVVPLTITPGAATAVVGDVLNFTLSGGTPDAGGFYSVRSNNQSILTVPSLASSNFSATLVSAGSTVVTVVDAQGQVKTVAIDVNPANTSLRLSPSSVSIKESETAANVNNIVVSVVGGSIAAGQTNPRIRAFSSNVARLDPTPSTDGKKIVLAMGSRNNLCFKPGTDTPSPSASVLPIVITAVDDAGASATMVVNITDDGGSNTVCTNN
jgi:hypothetical protein